MTTLGPLLGVVLSLVATPDEKDVPSLERLYSYPRIVGTAPERPAWSPDSRKIAFLWNDSGYDFRDIYVTNVETGATRRLTSSSASSPPAEGDPGIVEVSFHPDSQRLLYELAGELYLFEPGGIPQPIARGARGRLSPDGTKLAFLQDGNLWIVTLVSESDPRPLVSDPRAEVFVESFVWAPDGEKIAFLEIDERRVPLRGIPDYLGPEVSLVPVRRPFPGEEPRSQRLGIVSAQGGKPAFLDLGGEPVDPIFSYRWSSRGQLLVDTSDLYVKRRRILVIDPAREAIDVVYREDEPENVTAYWQAEWSTDGNTIYFLSDRDDDYHVYSVPSTGGEPRRITSGNFAVSELTVTRDALVFVANAPRPEERHVFRVGLLGGEPVQLGRGPGTHAPVVSPDGRHAAVSFSSDLMPPELFLTALDPRAPAETRLTQSPLPGFDFENWFRPEYVTFESHVDGATIHGRLLVPSTLDRGKKHPAIVGSIYANTVRNQWGGRNAHPLWGLERHLLDKGYVLFNMDVRGSWGHGKAFRRGIRLDYGGIDVEDIESGVRYLSSLPYVDSERIGIWGSSYGGLLASMSLFKKPGLFRAGVAAAPATNVFHALTGEMRVMMAPQDQAAAYEAASAFTHADGLRDPLLIIHGMRDRIVLYQDSLSLVDRLMHLGRNVDLLTLPDAGHGWDLEQLYETRFAFRKLVEFFDRHLAGARQ